MYRLTRTKTTDQWIPLLEANGLICGPVNNIEQVVHDPHILEREMVLEIGNEKDGSFKVVGTPMKFSKTPCEITKASPELGENTLEILSQLLDMDEEEIQALRESNTIYKYYAFFSNFEIPVYSRFVPS